MSFSIGAVIGTEEQRKIKEQEDYIKKLEEYITKLETEKNQLQSKLETQKFIDKKLKETIEDTAKSVNTIKDRLSPKSTVTLSLIIGIGGSLIASVLFKIWTDLQPRP